MKYQGSCHCGAIKVEFTGERITSGLRCNCSICQRRGALMTPYIVNKSEVEITIKDDALATYQFGSGVAKHHFCKRCGIYPFHETKRKKDHYRINIGCIDGLDASSLAAAVFDGASL